MDQGMPQPDLSGADRSASNSRGRPSAISDPEGYMRDFQQRMATMTSRASKMQEQLAEANVRLESEEREVAVTVNVGGALVGIEFGPSIRHISGPALSQMIMELYTQAATEASRRSVEMMSSILGEDSETLKAIRQSVDRHAPRED